MIDSIGFSAYTILLSVNKDTSCFPVYMLFIYISCLIVLARTSSTMLNRDGENRHTCLVSDLRGKNIQFFTIKCEINCRFIIDALCKFEEVSFYCQFAERFCFYFKSGMDIVFCQMPFLCLWNNHVCFSV